MSPFDEFVQAIVAERQVQDAKWGGPRHDDTHDCLDWGSYIQKHLNRLSDAGVYGLGHQAQYKQYVRIAALCFAAVESMKRNNKGGIVVHHPDNDV